MDGDPFSRCPYLRNVQRNRLGMTVSTVSTKSTDRIMQSLYRSPEYPHVDDRVTGPATPRVLQEGSSGDATP